MSVVIFFDNAMQGKMVTGMDKVGNVISILVTILKRILFRFP